MKTILISLLALLPSCSFLATNPVLDAELINIGEEVAADFYQYETDKPLFPLAPANVPVPPKEYKPPIQ